MPIGGGIRPLIDKQYIDAVSRKGNSRYRLLKIKDLKRMPVYKV